MALRSNNSYAPCPDNDDYAYNPGDYAYDQRDYSYGYDPDATTVSPTASFDLDDDAYFYAPQGSMASGAQGVNAAYQPTAAYRPVGAAGAVRPVYPGGAGYGAQPPEPPRKKKGTAGLVIAIILLIAGVALLAGAGYLWFTSQQKYEANETEYAQIAEASVTEDVETGRPVVDFAALQAQNAEIVGWIQIPGTPVNYPVVRHEDNDYYLNHSFLGRYDEFGAIFMDYRSSADRTDRNTVIYGHHLKNGNMFARVADYSNQAEFDTLSNIYYVTQDDEVHVLVPLCTIVVSGYDVDALQFDFATQADFEAYVQSLIDRSSARSATATSVGVEHIYMLSTCSYSTDNERTILVCTDLNGTNGPVVDATQNISDIQAAADEAAGITDGTTE